MSDRDELADLIGGLCANCDGRKCMGCVFREYDHKCADDCPDCCAEDGRFRRVLGGVLDDLAERDRQVRREVAEEIAQECESNIDWSDGRNEYGDNKGYEQAARIAREIGGRDE